MKKSITEYFNKWGGVQKTSSLLIFLFTLIFASCSNLFTSQESLPSNTKIHFTGTLCVTGALPSSLNETCHAELDSASQSSASRSALPSITLGSDYYYYFTAKQTSGGNSIISDNSLDNPDAFTSTSTGSVYFALELTTGKWDIECGIKKAASSGQVSENDVTVMSDTYPATISTVAPVLNHTFYPKPSQSGSGSLELTFTCENETVDSVIVKCGSDQWTCFNLSATQWTVSEDSIDSGTYDVNIYFYKNDGNGNPILVYSTTQTINIFDDMKTNTWVSDGSGLISGTGDFNLNSTLINQFARTTFYVGDTGVGKEPSDTEGTGSPYTPLASVTKAASIIAATGNSSKDYRIYVSGTVTGAQEISSAVNGKAQSITIQGTSGNSTDVLDGNNEGTTLTISTAVPVTIKNLKITGGSAENGGGINNSGTLSLSDGCLVAGNTASNFGGGVYSTGTMFMYGSAVIGDSTKTTAATDTTETSCSNKAGCGAGIYSLGNLYLGYSESNTKTKLTGGVFYNFSHDTGGIYQYANKTFLMNSGFVSYNAGRGIYVGNCSFTMSGGSVIGNTTFEPGNDYQTNGAGIYAGVDSTVLISGGTISGNEAGRDGGGLYIAKPETSVTIEGGTISGNTADGQGNGIAIANGSLKMKGNASVDSNNDVFLADEKYIEITDALTSTVPVAKVTLASYSRGTTIVQADGTNVTDLTQYKNYFTLTDQSWECKVTSDKQYLVLDTPIYVAGQTNHPYCGVAGNDTNGDGTKAKPFATIARAIELLTDKDTDYTIYIDGEVTGGQTIPDTLKKDETGTYKAQSLTIEGVNGINSTKEPLATLNGGFSSINTGRVLTIETDVPVKIKALTIKNGYLNEDSDWDGGGIYISSSSTVTLGDEGSINGDYTSTVLLTNNYGLYGNAISSEGVLTLCNCTFKNNNVADHSSSFTQGDDSPAISFDTNDLILAGGNIHFSSNTPGDIYIGAKTFNGSTGFSTPCKIQINVALPDDFSASLCAFGTAWSYSRLSSKQILNGLSSEYSKFSLYGITDTAHTYSIDPESGAIIQSQ